MPVTTTIGINIKITFFICLANVFGAFGIHPIKKSSLFIVFVLSFLLNDCAGSFCSFRVRSGIQPHFRSGDPEIICVYFLFEWRWRLTILWQVLITVPGTGYTSVEDFAFTKRPALVFTHIMNRIQ